MVMVDPVKLQQEILDGVQRRTRRMYRTQEQLGPFDTSRRDSIVVNIGRDKVRLDLQVMGSMIHVFRVKTEHTEIKRFRQNKAGLLPVDKIINHIVKCLDIEAKARQEEARARQVIRTAECAIKRLEEKGVPKGVVLAPSETGITIVSQGMTEKAAGKALTVLREVMEPRDESKRRGLLWDYLQDPDEPESEKDT